MGYNYKPLYCDTDSIVIQEQNKQWIKSLLNNCYGKQVKKYLQPTFIPQENKNMNRDYIVVHFADHKIGIIFKDKIAGVFNEIAGDVEETRIMTSGNYTFVMDKYADIVKQLI